MAYLQVIIAVDQILQLRQQMPSANCIACLRCSHTPAYSGYSEEQIPHNPHLCESSKRRKTAQSALL